MKRPLIIGAVVAVLGGLVLYRLFSIYAAGQATKRLVQGLSGPVTVAVGKAEERTLTLDYDPVGTVVAPNSVDIAAKNNGHIVFLKVRQGDKVRQGQVLVKIDSDEAEDEVLKAEGNLANARYTLAMQEAQKELNTVQSSATVLKAAADLDAARAEFNKTNQVHRATVAASKASLAESRSKVVSAQAQTRLARVDFEKARVHYDRMLELQHQGFASQADVYDGYQDLLSKKVMVERQVAELAATRAALTSSREQGAKENISAFASIQESRFSVVSKQAGLSEAEAATARTVAYEQQLRAQQALVNAAEAELKAARVRLEETTIRSPVNGFVADRKLDVGALASTGATILTVQSGGELWVIVAAPQELYSRLKLGASANVTLDGVTDDKTYSGKVAYKDRSIDAASRQFNLRIVMEDTDSGVRPGMFARVTMSLGQVEKVLSVPTAALFKKDREKRTATVYQVVKDKIKVVPVSFGPNDATYTSVIKGLEGGETVVTETAADLEEGQEVKPSGP